MKKINFICLLLFLSTSAFGQTLGPIAKAVQEAKATAKQADLIENILLSSTPPNTGEEVLDRLKTAKYYEYNLTVGQTLINTVPNLIALRIPYEHQRESFFIVDLIKSPDATHNYEVNVSSDNGVKRTPTSTGIHYQGVVRGMEKSSLVALSIFDTELMGIITIKGNGTINLGKLHSFPQHIIYNDIDNKHLTINCLTMAEEKNKLLDDIYANVYKQSASVPGNCIDVYFETDFDIFQFEGSVTNVENFVTGMYNQMATIYSNEAINTNLSEIFVWNTPDTYSNNSSTGLSQFVTARPTFNGDVAQLLTFRPFNSTNPLNNAGGRANGIGGLCVTGNPNLSPHAYTRLFPDYAIYPTFSRQLKVVTHEMGHNLGSRHTHACVWNGTNTAIDGCANFVEGSCTNPGHPPANTGTIMSYCDRNAGIDLFLGFGLQPGNVIRNMVTTATCLSSCCPTDLNLNGLLNAPLYEATNSILATGQIGAGQNVILDAGNFICLNPGFIADANNSSVTLVHIDGCNGMRTAPKTGEVINEVTQQETATELLPQDITNIKNIPNPFSEHTTFQFSLPAASKVQLTIYDVTGKIVATLIDNQTMEQGIHQLDFNAAELPNGMYLYQLATEQKTITKKMMVKH